MIMRDAGDIFSIFLATRMPVACSQFSWMPTPTMTFSGLAGSAVLASSPPPPQPSTIEAIRFLCGQMDACIFTWVAVTRQENQPYVSLCMGELHFHSGMS
jgi:hypothetical protein